MLGSNGGLTVDAIARAASEVRRALAPRLGVTEALPFAALAEAVTIDGPLGMLTTRARPHSGLRFTVFAMSEVDATADEAWIWLNREAWAEFFAGAPRTRATVAHELGHLALHAAELAELADIDADPDHDLRLDREAWTFAAHLTIPDQALRRLTRRRADEIARRFGVSVAMATKRLEEFARTA